MTERASKKIKVLIISASLRFIGGQSIQTKRLLETFENDDQVELEFLPIDPKNIFQNIKYLRTIFTSLKFWRLLLTRIYKFDVIQVFSAGGTGYVISTLPPLLFSKIYGKKVVLNYHSGELESHIEMWKKTALPTMRRFDEIVVPSQFLADVFEKHNLKAKVVFNFADGEKFKFKEREKIQPTFVSNRNFEDFYNVGDCLRAFQIVQQKFPEAKMFIAGFGSRENALRKLSEELNLENVEFVGRIPNDEMPQLLAKADILLNTSVVDNMPLSLIEAFAAGTLVVSYATGGIPYIVENGKTGLLSATNDFRDLAKNAIFLLENQTAAREIVSNARRDVEKYRRKNVRKDWLEFYKKAAG